ncbi:MAG: hypothetical protein NZ890_00845 [Myxococcota bacterium]|nr:hypothetical protein [Myxococcota bacterium]
MPFSGWYRSARAARIADGPDEVHKVLIARDHLRGSPAPSGMISLWAVP